MANLLCDEMLAPEFIQYRCRPELMAPEVERFFTDKEQVKLIQDRYHETHLQLRCDAARTAATTVLQMLEFPVER